MNNKIEKVRKTLQLFRETSERQHKFCYARVYFWHKDHICGITKDIIDDSSNTHCDLFYDRD
jgi:hypothetical protein